MPMGPEAIFERLVSFRTASHCSNLELIDFARDILLEAGIEPVVIESSDGTKANLYATAGPRDRGGVLLSGHTDVVPAEGQRWTVPPYSLTRRDGRFYGRGTADMKGFVACALDAMRKAAGRSLQTPLHIALSHDEEVGCIGVHSLIDWLERGSVLPVFCLVGEPTLLAVATGHKGKAALRATCTGREGHSAMAPDALNAIHFAAGLVTILQQRQERIAREGERDREYEIPYTTVHAGRIRGGSALNIVPNRCDLDFEFRTIAADDPHRLLESVRSDAEHLVAPFRDRFPEAGIRFEQLFAYPGLDTSPKAEVVAFAQSLVGAERHCKVAFGTEGGLFSQRLGIPTVVCGPGSMEQGHRPDEFIEESQIGMAVSMLERLLARLEAGLPPGRTGTLCVGPQDQR